MSTARALAWLGALLTLCMLASAGAGAVHIPAGEILGILLDKIASPSPLPFDPRAASIFWSIRLPRVLLSALLGAILASSGAALQALFRNPLADPALLGVSSGASLGAVAAIVSGAALFGRFPASAAPWILPAAAFASALLATWVCVRVASTEGRTRVAALLLAGTAVNAIAAAGVGFAMHVATDAELRNITFWTLGSAAGATWRSLAVAAPLLLASVLGLLRLARPLNAMLLGDREAMHLGVSVDSTRRAVVALTALGVGAGVAVAGVLSFVGLIVPHVVRLLLGPDHRRLLPGSALAGASLLTLADLAARLIVAPAELPVGIITAAVGAPLFPWQIRAARASELLR